MTSALLRFRQRSAVREVMFSGCLCVCSSMCPMLLTQYLKKYWKYFQQTFSIGAFWDIDESPSYGIKRSKFEVTVGPTWWKMHFLPARRYASAGLCDSDVSVCLSVRLDVRPSHAGIVPSRVKAGS